PPSQNAGRRNVSPVSATKSAQTSTVLYGSAWSMVAVSSISTCCQADVDASGIGHVRERVVHRNRGVLLGRPEPAGNCMPAGPDATGPPRWLRELDHRGGSRRDQHRDVQLAVHPGPGDFGSAV